MSIQSYLLYVVAPIISLAFIIIVFRFLKGPKVADRVVAIDLLITSGIGLIGILAFILTMQIFWMWRQFWL